MNQKIEIRVPHKFSNLTKDARYYVFYGGRGSAKSHSVARYLVARALYEPIKILCAREFQNSITDSVHALLSEVISDLKLDKFFEIKNNVIDGLVGSQFIFKGLSHNIEAIKSTEGVDIVWIEEAERVSQKSWDILVPTIRKPKSKIIVTFNPAFETDPTFKKFIKNREPNSLVEKVNYVDNPHFPEVLRQEMEHCKAVDFDKYLHIWEGNTLTYSDAQIFKGKYFVEEFDVPHGTNIYQGADWGFAKDPTCLISAFVGDGNLYVSHEAYGYQVELNEIPALFSKVPDCKRWKTYGDCARPETISYLKNLGFNIESAPKWSGSVEDGIEYLRQFKKIIIHPRCKNTIAEFNTYSYKIDKRTDDIMPIVNDSNNHCFAAGTLVTTIDGKKPIEQIKIGDLVKTRSGFNKVLFSGATNWCQPVVKIKTAQGREIICTPNHKIWTSNGFVKANALRYGDILTAVESIECTEKQLYGTVKPITAIQAQNEELTANILNAHTMANLHICTEKFGHFIMGQFQKAIKFTTKTVIVKIMSQPTSKPSPRNSMLISTYGMTLGTKNKFYTSTQLEALPKHGTAQQKESNSIKKLVEYPIKNISQLIKFVGYATKNLKRKKLAIPICSAVINASQNGDDSIGSMSLWHIAENVELSLIKTNTTNSHKLVHDYVVQVCDEGKIENEVYDLTVENEHEYFANEILVSNCIDALRYSISNLIKRKSTIYDAGFF